MKVVKTCGDIETRAGVVRTSVIENEVGQYLDVRKFYEADGELRPSKQGICIPMADAFKLRDIVDSAVND